MPLLILASPALLIWVGVPVIIITAEDTFTAAQLISRCYIIIHHGWPASQGSFRDRLVRSQLAAVMLTLPERRQSIRIPIQGRSLFLPSFQRGVAAACLGRSGDSPHRSCVLLAVNDIAHILAKVARLP